MGKGKDKKKKLKKQAAHPLVQQQSKKKQSEGGNHHSSSGNSSSGSGSGNKKDQITVEIDERGNTITLKIIDGNYYCTSCLSELQLSAKKSTGNSVSGKPLECSVCKVAQWAVAAERAKEHAEIARAASKKEISSGIKGLQNLGNTCFFNSIMQNLTHINALRDVLLVPPGTSSISNNPVKSNGPLTVEMHHFFTKMYKLNSPYISPHSLFTEICKKAPRFLGFRQQDAHELLIHLLDGLISEEQEATKNKRDPTYIDKIFGGRLISIITCFHCGYVSKTHEPFLDLSLPLPYAAINIQEIKRKALANSSSHSSGNRSGSGGSKSSGGGGKVVKPSFADLGLQSDDEDDEQEEVEEKKSNSAPRTLSKSQLKKQRRKEGKEMELAAYQSLSDEPVGADIEPLLSDKPEAVTATTNGIEIETIISSNVNNDDSSKTDAEGYEVINSPNGASLSVLDPLPQDESSITTDEKLEMSTPPALEPIIESTATGVIGVVYDSVNSDVEGETEEEKSNDKPDNLNDSTSGFIHLNNSVESTTTTAKDTSYHTEQQLSSYNVIDDYESKASPVSSALSSVESTAESASATSIIKDFEKIDISSSTTSSPSITGATTTTDDNSTKKDSDKDVKDEPTDLRKNLPIEAKMMDNLLACLMQFTNPEKLEGENGFICPHCKKLANGQIEEEDDIIITDDNVSIINNDEKSTITTTATATDIITTETATSTAESTEIESTNSNDSKLEEKEEKEKEQEKELEKEKEKELEKEKEQLPQSPPEQQQQQQQTQSKKKKKNKNNSNNQNSNSNNNNSKKKKEEEEVIIRRNASKQYLLANTPPYLTIQLKRFMQTSRNGFQKDGKRISYPLVLDLTAFTDQSSASTSRESHRYRLNGVVEHMGGMGGGHYVAHIYDDTTGQWYYVSDSTSRLSSLEQVMSNEAYVLFYKKLDHFESSPSSPTTTTTTTTNISSNSINNNSNNEKVNDIVNEDEVEVEEGITEVIITENGNNSEIEIELITNSTSTDMMTSDKSNSIDEDVETIELSSVSSSSTINVEEIIIYDEKLELEKEQQKQQQQHLTSTNSDTEINNTLEIVYDETSFK
ncbi:peptidase C19 family protein [Heterostelium album PN500]|uniref:Peptidase C19 family protein n=1 Tax=Heterostelium pallidum (strain ATCC 26659 / Pp 5 / PN500) TaxID=670386 RepID=D3BFC2_HETP5|nr:peptidase C19 family protein [Heterostelium album PN500]EFA79836.1 peptidase C19 family protein [Heterostelium album PN500]|eukprot:XP_020431957.1 peptidase C19 family protein [Heterostelium album PN500]